MRSRIEIPVYRRGSRTGGWLGGVSDLAVAFIARDRFSTAPASLASLFSQVGQSATVYIADAGYPTWLREELEQAASVVGLSARFLNVGLHATTNHSWNQVVRESSASCLLYLENDVLLEAGCIDRLMSALELGHGDIAAASVYEADRRTVHFSPVLTEIRSLPGGGYRVILDRGRSAGHRKRVPQAVRPISIFERHCFALTRHAAQALGDLDELMFCRTDLDLSLACHQTGLTVAFVPGARSYLDPNIDEIDSAFYDYRWDLHRVQWANERLVAKWGLVGYKNSIDHAHHARTQSFGLGK